MGENRREESLRGELQTRRTWGGGQGGGMGVGGGWVWIIKGMSWIICFMISFLFQLTMFRNHHRPFAISGNVCWEDAASLCFEMVLNHSKESKRGPVLNRNQYIPKRLLRYFFWSCEIISIKEVATALTRGASIFLI